jgi:hypothetical protein
MKTLSTKGCSSLTTVVLKHIKIFGLYSSHLVMLDRVIAISTQE